MPLSVVVTANFLTNLDSIREFLAEQDSEVAFDMLTMHIFDDVIPNLERFPKMGRDFLARDPLSEEGKAKLHALKMKSGKLTEIREYITGDYLLLYAVRHAAVFLLSIRHHRQLSFDLRTHWF